jgi:PAS domain S-box-containing protein
MRGLSNFSYLEETASPPHPRTIGWVGTTALAMGGSNQSLFLIGALIQNQGSAAVPLLILGLLVSWAAAPGWLELVLMWPNRVGGIAATCAEAFRPYSAVLANLAGFCYWWGWVPTCGLTAILSATAICEWYLPGVAIPLLASFLVLVFVGVNLCGVRWVTRLAIPIATVAAGLAFLSAFIPILSGHMHWQQATTFRLTYPFAGRFGQITSAMAGIYLIGFGAPAFEAATCHVGETIDPERNVPRAVLASALLAALYFMVLPVIWLGTLGPTPLIGNLADTLSPTFAPLLGSAARAAAMWFIVFNMFHGTLQPLAGASRTLMQLAEDGLLPRVLARRSRTDVPWVATLLTAYVAILFLLTGDPTWVIAAANLCYLIGIILPNVAVWLLRKDMPDIRRPFRAPRGTITLGLCSAAIWGISTVLGFEQYGLPTVIASMGLAYSGSVLYAWRRLMDRRAAGLPLSIRTLHLKLTGAMLLVLSLDGAGYLLAVNAASKGDTAFTTLLEDIFVAVALLTISVGLILPGMIGHAVNEVAHAANRLATGTLAELSRAMGALSQGNLDAAFVHASLTPIVVHSRDELHDMATSFNLMQEEIATITRALDSAREGLRQTRDELTASNTSLRVREEYFRTLWEHATDLVHIFNVKTILEYVSPSHESILGYVPAELQGRSGMEYVHPEDAAGVRALYSGLIRTPGAQTRAVYRIRHADMSWRVIEAIASNHLDNPIIRGVVVNARDITERAQAEEAARLARAEAEQANQAKSEFLSRMSHELRTPLNAILGFAQVLEMRDLDPQGNEDVGFILTAGRHLLRLIDEVLDISRIETGQITISLETIDLAQSIKEVLDLSRPLAEARHIRLIDEVTGLNGQRAAWHVQADRQRLAQILLNLVSNAIKYNLEHGIVTICCAPQPRARLRVVVQDTGVGLRPEEISRLFVPFERLHAAGTAIQGTGIGLALSKRLVEAMGGAIGVESVAGEGSRFWIDLPLAHGTDRQVTVREPVPGNLSMPRQAPTVLYIEDNLSNFLLIEHLLRTVGAVRLLTAMQGSLGLDLAREHQPDLILLDVHLPDILGDEVLRRLLDDPRTATIPVVVLSADASPRTIERLRAAGAKDYMTKPLDVPRFLRLLSSLLAGSST